MKTTHPNTTPSVITLEMIAAHCGVHYSTVQRALTGQGRVSPATRERIRAVAAAMGYDPTANLAASNLVMMRHGQRVINHLIACYLPPIFYQYTYFMRILSGLSEVLVTEQFDMLTTYYELPDASWQQTHPISRSIVSGNVDAVIAMLAPDRMAAFQHQLRATPRFGPRPIITLLEHHDDVSTITFDDYAGAYTLCDHLLSLGHRRLLYPHGNARVSTTVPERIRGCREAITRAGLSPERCLRLEPIVFTAEHPWEQCFADSVRVGLAAAPDTTAILLPNDTLAAVARQVLGESGRQVPRDISLVGFDDTDPLPDGQGQNTLTTMRLPLEEFGRMAARMAIRQISLSTPAVESLVLPGSLVVRRSTAPVVR